MRQTSGNTGRIRSGKHMWCGAAVCLGTVLSATRAEGAAYYLHANQSSTIWTTATDWYDAPTGGSNSGTVFGGNDFYSNGFTLRTSSDGTGPTLGNSGTTLYLNSKLVLRRNGAMAVANLVTTGTANLAVGNGGTTPTLTTVSLTNNAAMTINGDGTTGRTLYFNIGTLAGAGNISLGNAVNLYLNVTSAKSFTGNISWSDASILNFNSDLISGGGLSLSGSAQINLDQNVKFASLSIGGTQLAPGTYSFDYLNSHYDSYFVDGGSGSITVPEPASLGLVALGTMLTASRRRRRNGAR